MKTSALIACSISLASGLALAPSAQSATVHKHRMQNPATACTLAIPTLSTGVRPRATGFRNEGTVSNFVICGFDIDSTFSGYSSLSLLFKSFDGVSRVVDCTAMSRFINETSGEYVTKSVISYGEGNASTLTFSPEDFPAYGLLPWGATVTCLLPPGAAILAVSSEYDDEVGL